MSFPQTSYTTKHPVAFVGMRADLRSSVTESYLSEESTAFPFGVAVLAGTNVNGCKLPAASGDIAKLLGIASHTIGYRNFDATDAIPNKCEVNVTRRGMVWVAAEGAVTAGNTAFVRYASGSGGSQKGAFRADADTATAGSATGFIFRDTLAAAGLCRVELNLP